MLKEQYELVLKQLSSDAQALNQRFPELAVNLNRDNTDPDVARLLEGVALIAARQRELLEQDKTEQMQGWLQAVAPQILQPIPAMVLAALETPTQVTTVATGSEFTAQSNEQTVYWQAAVNTTLLPWQLDSVVQRPRELELQLDVAADFNAFDQLLDIYFVGERSESLERLVNLKKSSKSIRIQLGEKQHTIATSALQLKYQVSDGSWLQMLDDRFDSPVLPRWITEAWCYPNRMLALSLDLSVLGDLNIVAGSECKLTFQLESALSVSIELAHLAINALPLVNLQQAQLLPFARQPNRSLYELALLNEQQTIDQLVSIISVAESVAGSAIPYFSLENLPLKTNDDGVYQLLKQDSVPLVQIRLDRTSAECGLMQVQAYIHQGDVASELSIDTGISGQSLQGRLVTRPSQWVAAPSQQQAQWQALQVQQVATKRLDLNAIKSQLQVLMPPIGSHYDEHRRAQRALDALIALQVKDAPITRGTSLILGQEILLTINTAAFGEAEIWLFSTTIWQWLRARLAVNSVVALRAVNEKGESILYWPHASGTRAVV